MNTRLPIIAAAVLVLAGCGTAQSAQPATHAAASTTASVSPYDRYLAADAADGLTPEVQRGEAVKVAGNTCDNTVSDMTGLVSMDPVLYPSETAYQNFLTDRAHFIDAYCPDARVVFDAATQQVIGKVITTSH